MYIQIGDYEVSIYIFIAAGIIILGSCIFAVRLIYKKESKDEYDKHKHISEWQRINIVSLIDKDIEKYGETEGEDYVQVANSIAAYIKRNPEWSRRELLAINDYAISFLTTIISTEISKCVDIHAFNQIVLLANTVDYIYGGAPTVDGHLDWIGKDVSGFNNHPDMSIYEGRLLKIYSNALSDVWKYIDADLGKIPEEADVSSELKYYDVDDFSDALSEIEGCCDVNTISESTKNILCIMLNMKIQELVNMLGTEMTELKFYHIYYYRALACIADEKYSLYEDILDSIEE